MKKIVILDAKTLGKVENINILSEFGSVTSYETTSPEDTISRIADAEIVITNKVIIDKHILGHAKNLKLICISATGMNNVDLVAAEELGISVKNAVGYSSNSVAQQTLAYILRLYNQLDYYDSYVKNGNYSGSDIFTHYGPSIPELSNKTIGIIGLGNIGKTVARIVSAFGASVNYFSTSGANHNKVYTQVSLDELLSTSDIISIHAPLNENTQNLISGDQFSLMKPNAILINVGRGGIVDEAALAKAIDANKIAGAGVDVFVNEPINKDNPLLTVKHPEKLVMTPHNAWASIEARTKLIEIIYQNIKETI